MKRCYKCGIIFREAIKVGGGEALHCSDCPLNFTSVWGPYNKAVYNKVPIGCTDGYLRDYPPKTGPLTEEELA